MTIFYAPPPSEESQLSEILNAYFRGQVLYEIDFDSPPEFIDYVMSHSKEQDVLQQGIDQFYGEKHSQIIENNGWKLVVEGTHLNQPGLVCKDIGCLITIRIIDIIPKMGTITDRNTFYIMISYMVSDQRDTMGIAEVWVDTRRIQNLLQN